MAEDFEKLKTEIIDNVKLLLGESWKSLTKKDLDLIQRCAIDAAKLQLRSLTTKEDLTIEISIVNASLMNITVAKYFPIKTLFWESVQRAVTMIVSIAIKAAIAV